MKAVRVRADSHQIRAGSSQGGAHFLFTVILFGKITVLLFCLEKSNSSNNRHVLFFLPTGS